MGTLLRGLLQTKMLSTLITRNSRQYQYGLHTGHPQHKEDLSSHDNLSGLPNQQMFHARVTQALETAKERRYQASLIFLDIDRFKLINEALGHTAGDTVIQHVTTRILDHAPKDALFGRINGDMFAVFIPNAAEFEAVEWIEETLSKFQNPIQTIKSLHITLCAGIALFPMHGDSTEKLIRNVDTALNKAKAQGRSSWQIYNPSMSEQEIHQFQLENDLRHALFKKEFTLHYQPRISSADNHVVCVEALLRWNCPSRGNVSPSEFIPIAEDSGLMKSLDAWVLSTACKQGRHWLDHSPRPVRVAVNISAGQLSLPGFPALIRRVLKESQLPAEYLELEITESAIMRDAEKAIQNLLNIKSMGVHISVDDFGTGYSSLSYLSRLPVDILKIDRSFIRELTFNSSSAAITKAIISLADHLKINITVEGVETEDQYQYLRNHNSSPIELQGFYISRPIPVEMMTNYLCS